MTGKFSIPKTQTDSRQPFAGSGLIRPRQARQLRRARPLLDPLEERCLLSFGSPWLFDTDANNAANAAVAIGDIFGDSYLDLVTATPSGGLNIAQGNGDGSFQPPIPISMSIPTPPKSFSSVKLADLRDNPNGLDDIIAADPKDNKVWVLVNQGNGTFGTPMSFSTGSTPMDVAVADLGNGHLDIVTANSGDNTVSVLLGNGDGTFAPAPGSPLNVGAQPVALAIGALTTDGYPDIVTANELGNSVSVLRGNDDGTFSPALGIPITVVINSQISRESAPVDVALGDFNGDGNLDIVTANSGTASVNVMLGHGDGSFGIQQNIVVDTVTPSDTPTAVVAADLDGDGHADIAFTLPELGSVGVLSGNGDGTFATQVDYVVSAKPTALAFGNLNEGQTSLGNPRLDLVTVDATDSQAAVLLGQKSFIPTTLSIETPGVITSSTTIPSITWGETLQVMLGTSTGSLPQGFSLSGSFQLYLDGNPYDVPQPAGSAFYYDQLPVGLHTLSAHYLGDSDFQGSTTPAVTVSVVQAELTVTALDQSWTYGEVNPPAFTANITGFVDNETLATSGLTGLPSLSTAATTASPAGTYSIGVVKGSLASTNYTFSFQPGTLTITPAVLTVTAPSPTRAYGAANPTLICNITGFVPGESLLNSDLTGTPGVSSAAAPASPVGFYAVTPALGTLESNNYTFILQAGTLTVTPAVLTVAAVDVSGAYGAANPTLTYTITGFANGETATTGGVTGTPALSTTATANSPVGPYPITVGLGTLNATNYSFLLSSGPGTLTITPALLVVQTQDLQRSYGTTNPPLTYTLVREDQPQAVVSAAESGATGEPTLSTSADASSPVGSYAITVSPGTLAIANPNYVLDISNFQPGTFTITAAILAITANRASRAYGAADPTFTYTISGFIEGQTLATSGVTGAPSFTTTANSTSHVGNTYEIIVGIGKLQSANYLFSFMPNTLTITPAPLTIMANNTSQLFGTTPSLSTSFIGLVNGDTAASLTAPAILSTTATGTSPPGTYPITVSGARSADYSITYESGALTVLQLPTFSSLEGPILRSTVTSPVTFTVDVSSFLDGSVPLTGVVAFYDQAQMIGAAPVVNGIATLSTSALAEGNYMVYAVYQGDTNYAPSATGTIVQMVMSTAPAAPVKRAAPLPAHPKTTTPKPKAPAPKPKAHPVIKPKALPATKPRAAVPAKTPVKKSSNLPR